MIIDAHQHFWQLDRGDYGWLTPDLAPLYQDFMPGDLEPLLRQNGVEGTFLVQAAPTVAETEFLLQIAEETPFVLGVIGWVEFDDPAAPATIARLAAHPKLAGLRPMIQDIADDGWMLQPNLTPAFDAMIAHDLAFDALVLPRHLPNLRTLLARHPDLRVVIDHGAKPDIASGDIETWANDMAMIARETGAFCKLSGLVTEAGAEWHSDDLGPYIAHLFRCFGAERLMWGSDWPVVTLAADFSDWLATARSFVPDGPAGDGVLGQTACAFYKRHPA